VKPSTVAPRQLTSGAAVLLLTLRRHGMRVSAALRECASFKCIGLEVWEGLKVVVSHYGNSSLMIYAVASHSQKHLLGGDARRRSLLRRTPLLVLMHTALLVHQRVLAGGVSRDASAFTSITPRWLFADVLVA
jgi:hypothetical protein